MVIIAGQRPGDGAYRWGTRLRMFCLFIYGGGKVGEKKGLSICVNYFLYKPG